MPTNLCHWWYGLCKCFWQWSCISNKCQSHKILFPLLLHRWVLSLCCSNFAIARDPYWLFLKLVSRASMSQKILALTKFFLPIQNCVIIKMQLTTSKWKGCILFSPCYCRSTTLMLASLSFYKFNYTDLKDRPTLHVKHSLLNIWFAAFTLNYEYFLIKLSIWHSSTLLSMSLASLTPLSLSSKSSPLSMHPSLHLHHSLPPLPLDHPLWPLQHQQSTASGMCHNWRAAKEREFSCLHIAAVLQRSRTKNWACKHFTSESTA